MQASIEVASFQTIYLHIVIYKPHLHQTSASRSVLYTDMAEKVREVFSNHPVAAVAGTGAVLVAAPALGSAFGIHSAAGTQVPQNPHHPSTIQTLSML
jgi:hypothetical protein